MMLAVSIYQTENRKTTNPTFTVGYTFTINFTWTSENYRSLCHMNEKINYNFSW